MGPYYRLDFPKLPPGHTNHTLRLVIDDQGLVEYEGYTHLLSPAFCDAVGIQVQPIMLTRGAYLLTSSALV